LMRWRKFNDAKKSLVDGELVPDRNDEYMFYQTLVGAWPAEPPTAADFNDFAERIAAYMQKAIKEAKVHTSWVNPNEAYDRAVDKFVREVLVSENNDSFLNDFSQFQQRLAFAGMVNSLAQTLLKMTAPGVPDFYQAAELWDLNLVDPDNRRPVDFVKRRILLEELKRGEQTDRAGLLCDLHSNWQDGRVKLYLIDKTLNFRREHRELFQTGDYLPLYAGGKFRENICAFTRRLHDHCIVVAAPRLLARIVTPGRPPLGELVWENAVLPLPHGTPDYWHNILTGEILSVCETKRGQKGLPLHQIFKTYPVALIETGSLDRPKLVPARS